MVETSRVRKLLLKLKQLWRYGKVLPELDGRPQYVVFDSRGIVAHYVADELYDAARVYGRGRSDAVLFGVARANDPKSAALFHTVRRIEDGAIMVGCITDPGDKAPDWLIEWGVEADG